MATETVIEPALEGFRDVDWSEDVAEQVRPSETPAIAGPLRWGREALPFLAVLERERSRARRTGIPFSILEFDAPQSEGKRDEFLDQLRESLRATDHADRLAANRVGVLLWGIDVEDDASRLPFARANGEPLAEPRSIFTYRGQAGEEWPFPDITARELHDAREFRELAAELRMRSDRAGHPLVLLTLRFDDRNARDRWLFSAAPLVRITDHLGEWDRRTAGVLLWNVSEEDLCCFFARADHLAASAAVRSCSAYVYPTDFDFVRSEQRDAELAEQGALRPPVRTLVPAACSSLEREAQLRRLALVLSDEFRGLAEGVSVRPLEEVFVKRLPLWKRAIDIVGALFGLVLLLPIFLIVAMAVKFTSRGPVFFKQKRLGLGGREFTMAKFRSMCDNADAQKDALRGQSEQDGPAFKLKHDPRVTRVGRFLRKASIDELPQLWNVLVGDMTLVGPRPLEWKETKPIAVWQRRRLEVTPGLTCIWQIFGKSRVPFVEWMRMDLRYVKEASPAKDLALILATLRQIVLMKASH